MSTAGAFSGETYSTRSRGEPPPDAPEDSPRDEDSPGEAEEGTARRSSAHRNAARVLPDPVGATTSASLPDEIASHAPSCAGVGPANAPSNHARVTGGNLERGGTTAKVAGG